MSSQDHEERWSGRPPAAPWSRELLVGAVLTAAAVAAIVASGRSDVAVVAPVAGAWGASLLAALVGRSDDDLAVAAIGIHRRGVAWAALSAAVAGLALPALRPAAFAAAIGAALALLVLQLADTGPPRRILRRSALPAAAIAGAATTIVAAVVIDARVDGSGAAASLVGVLIIVVAAEHLAGGSRTRGLARAGAGLLVAAAIGAAPGGLVAVAVALGAAAAVARVRFPPPAQIPQALIDLRTFDVRTLAARRARPSDPGMDQWLIDLREDHHDVRNLPLPLPAPRDLGPDRHPVIDLRDGSHDLRDGPELSPSSILDPPVDPPVTGSGTPRGTPSPPPPDR